MNLLEKFNAMIQKPIKPKGDQTAPEDDESLSVEEKRQLAVLRKETMRQNLMADGFSGINTGPDGLS